jgi:hypothetical protein
MVGPDPPPDFQPVHDLISGSPAQGGDGEVGRFAFAARTTPIQEKKCDRRTDGQYQDYIRKNIIHKEIIRAQVVDFAMLVRFDREASDSSFCVGSIAL